MAWGDDMVLIHTAPLVEIAIYGKTTWVNHLINVQIGPYKTDRYMDF